MTSLQISEENLLKMISDVKNMKKEFRCAFLSCDLNEDRIIVSGQAEADTDGEHGGSQCSSRCSPQVDSESNVVVSPPPLHPESEDDEDERERSNSPEVESSEYKIDKNFEDRIVQKIIQQFGKEGQITNCDGNLSRVISKAVWDEKERRDHKEKKSA